MHGDSKINEYLGTVIDQIRWKKTHAVLTEELENHMEDQKISYIKQGLEEDVATDKAIVDMGDPIMVGQQLDRVHRPKPDWTLLILTIGLFIVGLLSQYFIGFSQENLYFFENHVLLSGVGVMIMFAVYFLDFSILGKYPKSIYFLLCIITFITLFSSRIVNGRSVDVIYPLMLFPVAYACFVYSMRNKGYLGILLSGVALFVPIIISYMTPCTILMILLCIACCIIISAAILKGWFNINRIIGMMIVLFPVIFTMVTTIINIVRSPWQIERVRVLLHQVNDPTGVGWMSSIIKKILSASQFIGRGNIGNYQTDSINKFLDSFGYSDFTMTYLVYYLGWIVFIAIVGLLLTFIIRSIMLCRKQKSVLGYLVSLSIIIIFIEQCVLYLFTNLGIMTTTSFSLPLISAGGKFILINMFLMGLLLSVSKTGDYVRDNKEAIFSKIPFIHYNDGKIVINIKNN